MGVYRVHNTVNDKSLVGKSRDLPAILNREGLAFYFIFRVRRRLPPR